MISYWSWIKSSLFWVPGRWPSVGICVCNSSGGGRVGGVGGRGGGRASAAVGVVVRAYRAHRTKG